MIKRISALVSMLLSVIVVAAMLSGCGATRQDELLQLKKQVDASTLPEGIKLQLVDFLAGLRYNDVRLLDGKEAELHRLAPEEERLVKEATDQIFARSAKGPKTALAELVSNLAQSHVHAYVFYFEPQMVAEGKMAASEYKQHVERSKQEYLKKRPEYLQAIRNYMNHQ